MIILIKIVKISKQKSLKQRLGTTINKTPIRLSGRIKILGANGQPRVINTDGNANNNNFKFRNQNRINNNQAFVINRVNTNNGFKKKCNTFILYFMIINNLF